MTCVQRTTFLNNQMGCEFSSTTTAVDVFPFDTCVDGGQLSFSRTEFNETFFMFVYGNGESEDCTQATDILTISLKACVDNTTLYELAYCSTTTTTTTTTNEATPAVFLVYLTLVFIVGFCVIVGCFVCVICARTCYYAYEQRRDRLRMEKGFYVTGLGRVVPRNATDEQEYFQEYHPEEEEEKKKEEEKKVKVDV